MLKDLDFFMLLIKLCETSIFQLNDNKILKEV
jgi:hypothetical protein